jgi:lipid A 3-O-deacylase
MKICGSRWWFGGLLVWASLICAGRQTAAETLFDADPPSLWSGSSEEPFRKGAIELSLSAGAGYGMSIFGSRGHHHWGLGAVELGWMLSGPMAEDHWYKGNFELLLQVFGGAQFHPETAYLAGGGPELRYNFLTGTRWVPFFSAGAGATSTDIRDRDLSTSFEFNLHAGPGLHFFLTQNAALTLKCEFIHLSNAGMDHPNLGVNSVSGFVGASWFF